MIASFTHEPGWPPPGSGDAFPSYSTILTPYPGPGWDWLQCKLEQGNLFPSPRNCGRSLNGVTWVCAAKSSPDWGQAIHNRGRNWPQSRILAPPPYPGHSFHGPTHSPPPPNLPCCQSSAGLTLWPDDWCRETHARLCSALSSSESHCKLALRCIWDNTGLAQGAVCILIGKHSS